MELLYYLGDYVKLNDSVDDYRLVDCSFHDELEALATLRQPCKIIYRTVEGEVVEVENLIVDVYSAHKADFLKLKNGVEIRLDRVISVNGKPVQFACT